MHTMIIPGGWLLWTFNSQQEMYGFLFDDFNQNYKLNWFLRPFGTDYPSRQNIFDLIFSGFIKYTIKKVAEGR